MALESGSPLSQQQQKIEEMIVRGIKSGNQTTRKFTRPWKCCCYCSLSLRPQQMWCLSIRDGHIIEMGFCWMCQDLVLLHEWSFKQKNGGPPTWKLSQLPPINYLISFVVLWVIFFYMWRFDYDVREGIDIGRILLRRWCGHSCCWRTGETVKSGPASREPRDFIGGDKDKRSSQLSLCVCLYIFRYIF
jgi:hypothetical protein